jgi:hypothetical protein
MTIIQCLTLQTHVLEVCFYLWQVQCFLHIKYWQFWRSRQTLSLGTYIQFVVSWRVRECTHYTYILLCKQTFQIRSVLVQSCTLTIHVCLWEIPRNYFPLYFSKERAYTSQGNRQTSGESASLPTESAEVATSASQGYRKLAFLSIDADETVRNLSI